MYIKLLRIVFTMCKKWHWNISRVWFPVSNNKTSKVKIADIDMILWKLCLKAVHVTKQTMFTKPEYKNSKLRTIQHQDREVTQHVKNIYCICFQNRTCYFHFFEMVKYRVKTSENRETVCSRFAEVLCWQTFKFPASFQWCWFTFCRFAYLSRS